MKMDMGMAIMLSMAWQKKDKVMIKALNREWFKMVEEAQKSE
jgi:hypothetical protein